MKSYFKTSQDKYNPMLSENKPVVIKVVLDSRDRRINYDNSYGCIDSLKSFTKKFSRDYSCLGIINFNEINFIFDNVKEIKKKCKSFDAQTLNSWFSQEIFYKINSELKLMNDYVYINVSVFNILENKKYSYIYGSKKQGFNNYIRYYSYKNLKFSDIFKKSQYEILDMLKDINSIKFLTVDYITNGAMYKFGRNIEKANMESSYDDTKLMPIEKVSRVKSQLLVKNSSSELDDI